MLVYVDLDVYLQEFQRKLGGFDRKVYEGHFYAVKHNGTHNRTGSDGGHSIYSRFQTKAYAGNSELLVMGFSSISVCQVLV